MVSLDAIKHISISISYPDLANNDRVLFGIEISKLNTAWGYRLPVYV